MKIGILLNGSLSRVTDNQRVTIIKIVTLFCFIQFALKTDQYKLQYRFLSFQG